jgi:GNAT superfamily N-acetyltransferase
MALTFRKFTGTDSEYEEILMVDNTASDFPKTVDDLRQEDSWWTSEQLHVRELIDVDNELAGASLRYNMPGEEYRDKQSGFYTLMPSFHNRGFERPVLEHLIESAQKDGAISLTTNARDCHEGMLNAIHDLGFEPTVSIVYSRLNLDSFESQAYTTKLDAARSYGASVHSSEELESRGIDLFDEVHRLMGGTLDDAFKERQRQARVSPQWFPESQFGAYVGDRFVGVAFMNRIFAAPDIARVSYTTVHPDFRRNGIATALKVASIKAAQRCGIRSAVTCNESTIPMLQLNYQLGFMKEYENLCFKKDF